MVVLGGVVVFVEAVEANQKFPMFLLSLQHMITAFVGKIFCLKFPMFLFLGKYFVCSVSCLQLRPSRVSVGRSSKRVVRSVSVF